jgi:hypothetical protein
MTLTLVEAQKRLVAGCHIVKHADHAQLQFQAQCRRWRLVAVASSRDER